MPTIHVERALSVPAVPAQAAASAILHEIAEERGDWKEFALYLQLGALGFPDVGFIAIPARIDLIAETNEPQHSISFKLSSKRSPDSFPILDGAIGIEQSGPSTAMMSLDGTYTMPGGPVGAVFNRIVGQNAADNTLENMTVELADAVEARVQKREMKEARYRVIFNAGD